jgi:hypothetical protein
MSDTHNNQSEQEASQWKMPFHEVENLYEKAIAGLGKLDDGVERIAASVFYGYHKGWNLSKIIKSYSLPQEAAQQIWNKFNFSESTVTEKKTRTRSKQNAIVDFLNTNSGKVITPADLAKDLNISLPTFYNFYNANRHYFKKVQRGVFEILNPQVERASSK